MRPEDAFRIRHMIEAATDIVSFTAGRARADLDRDRMLALALARAIEIFGEAAAKTSAEARKKLPAVAWGLAAGMRNRLARLLRHRVRFALVDGD